MSIFACLHNSSLYTTYTQQKRQYNIYLYVSSVELGQGQGVEVQKTHGLGGAQHLVDVLQLLVVRTRVLQYLITKKEKMQRRRAKHIKNAK